jgi:PmbA protein
VYTYIKNKEELMEESELADDIMRKALSRGCAAAEVFIKQSNGISVEAKDGQVEALEASKGFGLALKVVKKQKLGFSFTTDKENIEQTISSAVQSTEWTGIDEYVGISVLQSSDEVLIYDERINTIKEDDVIKDALLLEKTTLSYHKRIRKVRKAEVGVGQGRTTIVNSNGVNASYRSSYCSAHVTALAQDESGESQMGWDYAGSRKIDDVDIKSVGERAAQRATELLGSRKISAVKVPVILSDTVAVDFLEILTESLSAEAVQKKRSFLADRIGQSIISPLIDVCDDGTMSWRTGSSPVDDEGVPTRKKILISRGVLKGYMHNTYTAKKDGVQSTGNAVRSGSISLPGVGVTNAYIKPGELSHRDLMKSLPRGILILSAMGVHTANPVSGDFSIGISGLWVENGEPLYPVKEAIISGNILEMFKNVEGVGSNLAFYGSTGSPSILIGEMDISA